MNTAFIEPMKPSVDLSPKGKTLAKTDSPDKFEEVLDGVSQLSDSSHEGGERPSIGSWKRPAPKAGPKSDKPGEDKLEALVDAVAAKLGEALAELTKAAKKPQPKATGNPQNAAKRQAPRSAGPLLPKTQSAKSDEDAPAGQQKQQGTADKSDLADVQRVMAPRETAPVVATRATPFEVRLAATVQSPRPVAAVAPTNQYIQIQPAGDGGAATIRLDLGNGTHLDVALDVRDGVARVHLRSNGADVTNKMAQSAGDLVKALMDAGVESAEVDIEWDEPESNPDEHEPEHTTDDGEDDDESDAEKFSSFVHIVT